MKFSSFMNCLLTSLIPPEINLVKISRLKFMFTRLYLCQYLMDSNKQGLKYKFRVFRSSKRLTYIFDQHYHFQIILD